MFSKRLSQARKAKGLTLRDLGSKVGVSHASIKKYEDGEVKPSSTTLLALGKALGVRIEYFFRPDLIKNLNEINFRKHEDIPQKQLKAITHKVIEEIERRVEFENIFPISMAFPSIKSLPKKIESFDEIEHCAEIIRAEWKLGIGPIPDLVDTFEMHGIRVFTIALDVSIFPNSDMFDGLYTIINNEPVIVINGYFPGDRQRFTLAHELGHLMLEDRLSKHIDKEKACNRFAGAFLFSKETVFKELGHKRTAIELKELDLLKQEFGVSMMCILHRAEELKIINKNRFDKMYHEFKDKGWYKQEPGKPYPREKAHFFEQSIFHALAEDCIGESKAAELLGIPLTEFRSLRAMESKDAFSTHQ